MSRVSSSESGAPPPALALRGVTKRFGETEALRGLDMRIERGELYAFLGPNGAGKSTMINIVTGLYAPDTGEVQVLGRDIEADALRVKTSIGVVPEELALFERLTGLQYLCFCGRMYGLSGAESAARAEELLRLVELEQRQQSLVATYSKGMRRRIAIAAALVHGPQLVLLDEPFEGVDVLAAGVLRALLEELRRRGVTVLLTTHILEVADRLATHAGILNDGRLLDSGPVRELCARHESTHLREVFERLIGKPAASGAAPSFLSPAEDTP